MKLVLANREIVLKSRNYKNKRKVNESLYFLQLGWKTISSTTTHWFPWVPFMHTLSIFDQLVCPHVPEGKKVGALKRTPPHRLHKVGGDSSTQDGLLWIINELRGRARWLIKANYTQALLAINHTATIHLPLSWGHIAGMKGVAKRVSVSKTKHIFNSQDPSKGVFLFWGQGGYALSYCL